MQVKDYLQALSDENRIRVEKIGSGNWYWSFMSEEKQSKERVLGDLRVEQGKVQEILSNFREKISEAEAAREDEGDDIDGGDREALVSSHSTLQKDVETLKLELTTYSENDPTDVLRKELEAKASFKAVERWTENIQALEAYILEVTGDRQGLEYIQRSLYGEEYQEGEGLTEILSVE